LRAKSFLGLVLLLVSCSTAVAPPAAPPGTAPAEVTVAPAPAARVAEVAEQHHGFTVRDPYRWMEAGGDEFNAWLDAHGKRSRAVFDALPLRAEFLQALTKADQGVTRVSIVGVVGAAPRVFLMKRRPTDDVPQLWVRDGWNGEDRLLIDPRTRNAGDVHYAIDYAQPSWDGRHLAYGISASGSEDSVIEVMEVDTGKVLPERIDRSQYAGISWRPDNRSFFYWRRAKPAPGATRADWFKNSATYLHVLGDDPEKAVPVFGPMISGLGICEECFSAIEAGPRSRWALAVATPGTSADLEYFVAPLDSVVPGAQIPWRRISGPTDHVYAMTLHGDQLIAVSYDGAPRYKVLELDAATGTLAGARELLPQSAGVIENFVVADDGLYVALLEGGLSRIERVRWDNGAKENVAMPYGGSLSAPGSSPGHPGIWFTLDSWTRSPRIFRAAAGTPARDLGLIDPWPIDYTHIASEEVEVRSADGTMVPMSIVSRKDAKKDGTTPALLTGYAAYGSSQSPYFWPFGLTWVDEGGVFAECHARGGGARGKEWHLAGSKHNKERGFEDMIACAEHLVARGYTAPSRLSITGTSAGGFLVGGVITRRPDLFTSALMRVPVADLMRFESTEGGPANVPEYGTIANVEDFRHLLAVDPFHRIKDGTRYPAVIVTGGMHDVRVPVWQPAKFAARLQSATTGGPVLLRVETGGGHGLGSTRTQIREEWADLFAFALWRSR